MSSLQDWQFAANQRIDALENCLTKIDKLEKLLARYVEWVDAAGHRPFCKSDGMHKCECGLDALLAERID